MRIGTWNVEYAYQNRLAAIQQVIADNPADLWVLTETHDELAPTNCTHCAHSDPRPRNWSGIRDGSRWVSIWSSYPIVKQITLPSSDRERTVIAMLDLGESKSLLVYGTVLPWKGDRGIQDWSEHHRVIDEQIVEWLLLRRDYPNIPLCIAGDYNTDMGTGRYYGTKQGIAALRDGLAKCDLFCATAPERFPTGMLPYPPIDHISLPVSIQSSTSIATAWPASKSTLSDHSGLIVAVER